MSLHVRLKTSFWTNRKTLRLRVKLGNDAFWIPPRLWSYAAENQPDGDFSNYSAEELAFAIGYLGNAADMLKAMQQACFLDGMKVHDWQEHNGYHAAFSERGKKGAAARWQKKRGKETDKKGKEKKRKEASNATSINGRNSESKKDAESVYAEYPLKIGKPKAIEAIQKALRVCALDDLLAKTRSFAAVRNGDLSFVPHPTTWFNQQRFNDDPETWKPKGNGSPSTNGKKQGGNRLTHKLPTYDPETDTQTLQ